MIWVIAGTSDAKELLKLIHGKRDYIATVATEEGKREFEGFNIHLGRLKYEEMIDFLMDKGIKLIVDMSHPFAKEVSSNAKKAAEEVNLKYIRYLREEISTDGAALFDSFEDAANYLKDMNGDVFFTIGSKNIGIFERIRNGRRFIYRVLPAEFSIRECINLGIKLDDIIAMKGTFSVELNAALFSEFGVKYVVMKDSGKEGGTTEKIEACKKLGIIPLVIKRPKEEGFYKLSEIVDVILNSEW